MSYGLWCDDKQKNNWTIVCFYFVFSKTHYLSEFPFFSFFKPISADLCSSVNQYLIHFKVFVLASYCWVKLFLVYIYILHDFFLTVKFIYVFGSKFLLIVSHLLAFAAIWFHCFAYLDLFLYHCFYGITTKVANYLFELCLLNQFCCLEDRMFSWV